MERTTAKIFIALSVVHIQGGTRAGLQLHADDSGVARMHGRRPRRVRAVRVRVVRAPHVPLVESVGEH